MQTTVGAFQVHPCQPSIAQCPNHHGVTHRGLAPLHLAPVLLPAEEYEQEFMASQLTGTMTGVSWMSTHNYSATQESCARKQGCSGSTGA